MTRVSPVNIADYNATIAALNGYNSRSFGQNVRKIDTQGVTVPGSQKPGVSNIEIAPTNAKENYERGLAPSLGLTNVSAGFYKDKPNILNEIAIA